MKAPRCKVVRIQADRRARVAALHYICERTDVRDVPVDASFTVRLVTDKIRFNSQRERHRRPTMVVVDRRDGDGLRRQASGRVVRPAPRVAYLRDRSNRGDDGHNVGRHIAKGAAVRRRVALIDRDRRLSTVIVGLTLFTIRRKVWTVTPPSSSVAVIVTVCFRSSVALYDQFQAPALYVTVPIEAATVTVSAGTSAYVPLLVAVGPSLTVTSAD